MGAMMYFVIGLFLVNDILAQLAFYAGGFFRLLYGVSRRAGGIEAGAALPYRLLSDHRIGRCRGRASGGGHRAHRLHADYDLPLLLPVVSLLAIFVAWRRLPRARQPWLRWIAFGAIFYAWNVAAGFLVMDLHNDLLGDYFSVRNFYGRVAGDQVAGNRQDRAIARTAERQCRPRPGVPGLGTGFANRSAISRDNRASALRWRRWARTARSMSA